MASTSKSKLERGCDQISAKSGSGHSGAVRVGDIVCVVVEQPEEGGASVPRYVEVQSIVKHTYLGVACDPYIHHYRCAVCGQPSDEGEETYVCTSLACGYAVHTQCVTPGTMKCGCHMPVRRVVCPNGTKLGFQQRHIKHVPKWAKADMYRV